MKNYLFSVHAIYGMILAKMEILNRKEQLSVCQLVIESEGSLHTLFRARGFDRPYPSICEPEFAKIEKIIDGLTVESTFAQAIIEENRLLQNGWRIYDRRPAREVNGLEVVARAFHIERLLVGMDQRHSLWRTTPPSSTDWRRRAHAMRLSIIGL